MQTYRSWYVKHALISVSVSLLQLHVATLKQKVADLSGDWRYRGPKLKHADPNWKMSSSSEYFLQENIEVLGYRWFNPKHLSFFYFDTSYSPIFLLSKNGTTLYISIASFDFMGIYVERVSLNIGENALSRKNGQFSYRTQWI